ncbi:MAG: S53 family peptidase [Rhizomicrobium sp.]
MFWKSALLRAASAAVCLSVLFGHAAAAAQAEITAPIDDNKRVTLGGNTSSEATAENDRGMVPDWLPIPHMQLLLRRSPAQEETLQRVIAELHDPAAPDFHKWLTARELGDRFGVTQQDIGIIAGWLASLGFHVDGVLPSRMAIEFSGTAGDVREAFHTQIHALRVDGADHIANMSDPQIPVTLAPAVTGVVSLHDFRPQPTVVPRTAYTFGSDQCWPLKNGHAGPCYTLVPADLATIYNFNPAFRAGITGTGESVVVIEDTDVYNPADWTTFRSTFGLSGYMSGSFTQVHPQGGLTCTDPGVVQSSQDDAILDAQWSSAAAPDAAIVLASCQNSATFGGLIALENLLGGASLPASVSISYAECEAEDGAAANAAYNDTYEQAAAEGVSVFASAGDDASASCDVAQKSAAHGVGVSGLASSPYDVAVGGTDFGDAYAGTTSTYWNTSNTSVYGSAKSYIPEIPWSDSCASVLMALYYSGSRLTYGQNGYCNAGADHTDFLTTVGGSGGPSGCATGSPQTYGVVSGSCAGWPKPSWQAGFIGVRNDGVRDVPDVSLFAGNGIWSHYYIYCDSDGGLCTGAPSNWGAAGGTSFSTPIMAGVQALIAQKTGQSWGNPNPVFYRLAQTEYGAAGDKKCNSTRGNKTASSCVFHDVEEGDNDIDCTGRYDCYLPSGGYGVLSTSHKRYKIAYGATKGWDFPTGIGTPNVTNLLAAWPSGARAH